MSAAQHFHRDTEAEEVANLYAGEIKSKTVLITGASGKSIGAETARVIAKHGAKLIILAGRTASKIEETIASIHKESPDVELKALHLDLGSLKQVRQAAQEVLSWPGPLDILINNAGIMATPYEKTAEGFESQFGTNHLGHFLFTNLLVPRLLESKSQPRIVNVASSGHRRSDIRWDDIGFEEGKVYNKHMAYSQSKTANILFTVELASKFSEKGITALVLNPGVVPTGLVRNWEPADYDFYEKILPGIFMREGKVNTEHKFCKTIGAGTSTTIRAAFDPDLVSHSGSYLNDAQLANDDAAPFALDKASASRLWKLSEGFVGQTFD